MRNIYQERMVKKTCRTRDEWDYFCDQIYHERRDEESIETEQVKKDLDNEKG